MRTQSGRSRPSTKLDRGDFVLFIAIAVSMGLGIFVPSFGLLFEPFLLVWLGILLFLNLIRLEPDDLVGVFKNPKSLIFLSAAKLVMIPLAMYAVTRLVYEPLAIPVLLLSGISTGLGAPFMMNVVWERKSRQLPLVVAMVVVTSLAVPFTLPSLVYFLLGNSEFEIPILDMVSLLAMALFLPIAAGWVTKKRWPEFARKVDSKSFPPSILLVAFLNLGVFAQFSDYFFTKPDFLLVEIVASFALFLAFSGIGYFASTVVRDKNADKKESRTAGIIVMSYVNNVLVVVFASQFFGPDIAALAAFYNLPYYGLIIALKKFVIIQ